MVVAWLFDPLVKKLKKKGIKRSIGAIIVYVILIAIIVVVVGSIIPVLIEQINDFAKSLPSVFDSVKGWIENIFNNLKNMKAI